MAPSIDPTILLLLAFAALAAVAGVGALVGAKVLNRRRLRAEEQGQSTSRRWGGRDRERMYSKYFEKERRARAQRARTRATHGAFAGNGTSGSRSSDRSDDRAAEPSAPVNLERLHGETLGLRGEVTPDEVRRAYKARVREYHPDQVARLGIKLRTLAEEETKRINQAYAYFRKRYGF